MHSLTNSPSATFCRSPMLDPSHPTCHLTPFTSMRCRDVRRLTKLVTTRSRHPRLAVGVHSKRRSITTSASSEAAECISRGLEKYANGDRMGALNFFEESLKKDPTASQRQAALFNSTAVHASFGDIELAQITLREGVNCGLNFEGALKSTDNSQLVRFQGSPQIVIQLRKFAEAVRRIKGAIGPAEKPAAAPSGRSAASAGGGGGGYLGRDMSNTLRTDMTGIDPSLGGIFKRVAGLLVTGLVLGTILFYVGLQLTFPSYN